MAVMAVAVGLAPLLVAFPRVAFPAEVGAGEILASIVRGGRLYDNWFQELDEPQPTFLHPAYPRENVFVGAPEDTWLCHECHGWDYRGRDGAYATGGHFTGIRGIDGMAGADPAKIVAILKDDVHQQGVTDENGISLMEERDLRDLANFVSRGQVDMGAYIDGTSLAAKGDKSRHQTYFNTICGICHGADGLTVRTVSPLGKTARSDPWQALHKILNGKPAGMMPALRVLGREAVADILAHAQSLPTEEVFSSIVRGGRLYDNWFEEIDVSPPTKRHPAYPATRAIAGEPRNTWRCKECHGWDYRGSDGAFATGKHFTGIKGIQGMAGADPAAIVAVLKDDTHAYRDLVRYRGLMNEHDLRDLANFVSKGQIAMDRFIDPASKSARVDADKRADYYKTMCANCHGLDGDEVVTMLSLGRETKVDPWQALHKIINGHATARMPALRALGIQTAAELLSYIQTLPRDEDEAPSVDRGGRLYDNWIGEKKAEAPTQPHPASLTAKNPPETWRCVTCHGWDYGGVGGVKGIGGMAGADARAIVAVLTDKRHGYRGFLDERDLDDLAAFVGAGQVDMDVFIDRGTMVAKGEGTRREALFVTVCANCHGTDGLRVRTMPPLGKLAQGSPWEALHKILNGHPAGQMPALRVLDAQVLSDILAHIQSLPSEEVLASIVRGGRLYDNWMEETDAWEPKTAHPAYPANGAFAIRSDATWRCKECHGWDYKGKDGAYGKGRHFTGIVGIRGMAGADAARIADIIRGDTHGYGKLLTDHDIRDLANFVGRGQVDMNAFIDRPSKVAKGDKTARKDYFDTICAGCHGVDGTRINTISPLGRIATRKPWETLHILLNGHPDEWMPALRVLDRQVLGDMFAYIQALPKRR